VNSNWLLISLILKRLAWQKKTGNKFSLLFRNGKVDNVVIASPVAAELASNLLHDDNVKVLFAEHDYRIAMNTKYQLSIAQVEREEKKEIQARQLSHA